MQRIPEIIMRAPDRWSDTVQALIVPCCEEEFSDTAIPEIREMIEELFSCREFTAAHGQLTLVHRFGKKPGRILFVGLGSRTRLTRELLRRAGSKSLCFARENRIEAVSLDGDILSRVHKDHSDWLRCPAYYFLEGGLLGLYRFVHYKTDQKEFDTDIRSIEIPFTEKGFPIDVLRETIESVAFARDMVNMPANEKGPYLLCEKAALLSGHRVEVSVLDGRGILDAGMGAFYSVSKGSAEPPAFILVHYKGAEGNPIALIGKTITFDSGGISLKNPEGMEKMKYDMAGGAVVLSVIKALSRLMIPANVIAILPAAENLPGGKATRPGDVVKTLSGKTIEIISTDAEGRLTLADAFEYAVQYLHPSAIIDIATLTGACSVAFGNEAIAMMGNNEDLMQSVKKASDETFERVWQMPLYDEYKDELKSTVADMKNVGNRNGSLLVAGIFLKQFAGSVPWVHLDIAGTAWNDKDKAYSQKGASGIGVRLLLSLIADFKICLSH